MYVCKQGISYSWLARILLIFYLFIYVYTNLFCALAFRIRATSASLGNYASSALIMLQRTIVLTFNQSEQQSESWRVLSPAIQDAP